MTIPVGAGHLAAFAARNRARVFAIVLLSAVADTALRAPICDGQQPVTVRNPAPNFDQPAFRLSSVPLTVVGLREDTLSQLWATGAVRLTQRGTLVVAMRRTMELREFDANGNYIRTIGRRGAGPGEFRSVASVVPLPGDSLLVFDIFLRRVTLFGPARTALASYSVPGVIECCSPGGFYLAQTEPPPPSPTRTFGFGEWTFRSLDTTRRIAGQAGDSLRLKLASRAPTIVTNRQPQQQEGGFFSFSGVHRVPFHINPVVTFAGESIVHTTGERFSYRSISRMQRDDRVVQVDVASRPVTRTDINAMRDSLLATVSDRAAHARLMAELATGILPSVHPYVDRIIGEADGTVWVRVHRLRNQAPGEIWCRFDAQGRVAGVLKLHPGDVAKDFDRNRVVVSTEDAATGFETVRVYAIESAQRNAGRLRDGQ